MRDHLGALCWCLTTDEPFYECTRAAPCPQCHGFGYLMEHDGVGGTFDCPTCHPLDFDGQADA